MAKGYWIALVDVADPEQYKAYIAANALRSRTSARGSWFGPDALTIRRVEPSS